MKYRAIFFSFTPFQLFVANLEIDILQAIPGSCTGFKLGSHINMITKALIEHL